MTTPKNRQFDMASATDVGRVRAHNEDSISAEADLGLATLALADEIGRAHV